ncbi:hypothetical protein [Pareuzebyella sediminis]|uniref:hypothetical protein n=1 Tax=Pareuzebyella sediminis TaxID=2607998 RepID=UPI0011F084F8|nr:hypothetical protein [Pareuzebyella sediminis]
MKRIGNLKNDWKTQVFAESAKPDLGSPIYLVKNGKRELAPKGLLEFLMGEIMNIGDKGTFMGWHKMNAAENKVTLSLQKAPVRPNGIERILSQSRVKLAKDRVKERNPFLKIIADSELLKRNK